MTILAFCMPERGHFNQMLPVISSLAERGEKVIVMTASAFAEDVRRVGGFFYDLFTKFPIEAADGASIPIPSRYVSFAGFYGDKLIELARSFNPSLILYETFAVAGPLIGEHLEIPYINVAAGHAAVPERVLAALEKDPRVAIAPACLQAVSKLKIAYGLSWANPLCFVQGISPFLNIYSQPPQYLPIEDRSAFHPLVFFGSLDPGRPVRPLPQFTFPQKGGPRIFISFGTVIWRYWREQSIAALEAIALACPSASILISLGGHTLQGCERLQKMGAQVLSYVDQWSILKESDIFVTHHGFNSTHEGIFHRVPMISYPFYGDRESMARHAEKYGLSVPIVTKTLECPAKETVARAVEKILSERETFARNLEKARNWELEVINERPFAIDRILSLKHSFSGKRGHVPSS